MDLVGPSNSFYLGENPFKGVIRKGENVIKQTKWFYIKVLAMLLISGVYGCALNHSPVKSSIQARSLSQSEKLQDFDVALTYLNNFYAPLQYKEQIFKLDLDNIYNTLRIEVENSKSDLEFYQILAKLFARFRDSHLDMKIPFLARYALPFQVDQVGEYFVLTKVNSFLQRNYNLREGDELLSIDGKTPTEIVEDLKKYHYPGDESFSRHLWAFYLTYRILLLPKQKQAQVVFKRESDGKILELFLPWEKVVEDLTSEASLPLSRLNDVQINFDYGNRLGVNSEFGLMGDQKPFFINSAATNYFKMIPIHVADEEWDKKDGPEPAPVFAMLYRYKEKMVFLLRIHSYKVPNQRQYLATYRLLLKKYRNVADVLVLDQTNNPGGQVTYMENLAKLFLVKPSNGLCFVPRADRMWLAKYADIIPVIEDDYIRTMYQTYFDNINQAHENGDFLAPPISFTLSPTLNNRNVWDKPIVLLINELSVSAADAFPLILKENKRATLFGERTVGGGGNVENMPALPNSGVVISLTRSMFYLNRGDNNFSIDDVIENNGVYPHIPYRLDIEDHQNYFINYIRAFSETAIQTERTPEPYLEMVEGDRNSRGV